MRVVSSLVLTAAILAGPGARADTYARQPKIDVLHYQLEVEISDRSDTIVGTTRLEIAFRSAAAGMALDLVGMEVERLAVGGAERPFTHRDGRLAFEFGRLYRAGEIARVEVRYRGIPEKKGMLIGPNGHGRRVFFAENWPDGARHWFPAIDHPSDKATVELAVTAPEKYEVVGNGRLVEIRSLLDGRKLTRWFESVPIPTYAMVLGAAEFSVRQVESAAGVPISIYAYPADAEAAARKFARTGLALQFFVERIGPYPYEKLAQVESTTRIGGMENSSAIFYAEGAFRRTPVTEAPMPHEVAHQWFGDSVTPGDWDHLWLSEGFATYFDYLFYEHLEGPGALRRLLDAAAARVKKYHDSRPAPVVDPNLTDLVAKLNPLTYQKGAWILHMLRRLVGDATFFAGIRRYYVLHAGRNAASDDFQRVMESVSARPLERFFRQWLDEPGWPDFRVTWRWDAASGEVEIDFDQVQPSGPYATQVELAFGIGARAERRSVEITERRQSLRVPLPGMPTTVEVDPDGSLLKSVTVVRR